MYLNCPAQNIYIPLMSIIIMKLYCEIVAEYMPAVRALLAKEFLNKGLTQTEVAKKLEVTQSAVSQYARQIRGAKTKMLAENQEFINQLTKVAQDPNAQITEKILCDLCTSAINDAAKKCPNISIS